MDGNLTRTLHRPAKDRAIALLLAGFLLAGTSGCREDAVTAPAGSRGGGSASFSSSAAAASYHAINLGQGGVGGVNAAGDAVGALDTSAVKWPSNGSAPVRLQNYQPGSGIGDVAHAINNHGDVVGYAQIHYGEEFHAVIWPAGGAPRLLVTSPDAVNSSATGINDAGDVVGYMEIRHPTAQCMSCRIEVALVWRGGGAPTILPGDASVANAINNRGEIVGHVGAHAVLWPASGGVIQLSNDVSQARAINDVGVVVGGVVDGNAVMWTNDAAHTQRTLPGYGSATGLANGINLAGDIVGSSGDQAVLWPGGGAPQALPPLSDGTPTVAMAITNNGQIVGVDHPFAYNENAIRWVQSTVPPAGKPTVTPNVTSPTPPQNGWYSGDVTVAWNVSGADSRTDGCATRTIASDTRADGLVITCSATNGSGTTTESVTIKRDATKPVITYGKAKKTYRVDDVVDISCNAVDVLSGISTTNCARIRSDAYTFIIGENYKFSTATDKSGNEGYGDVRFTVAVTSSTLCKLTERWTSKNTAKDLCKELSKKQWSDYQRDVAKAGLSSERAAVLAKLAGKLAD